MSERLKMREFFINFRKKFTDLQKNEPKFTKNQKIHAKKDKKAKQNEFH